MAPRDMQPSLGGPWGSQLCTLLLLDVPPTGTAVPIRGGHIPVPSKGRGRRRSLQAVLCAEMMFLHPLVLFRMF